MRCKVGDLAVVVRSEGGNEGKIVRCLEFLGMALWYSRNGEEAMAPTWRIDRTLKGWDGRLIDVAPDDSLRPIRDQPGEDETLGWAPIRETVPARQMASGVTPHEWWGGA